VSPQNSAVNQQVLEVRIVCAKGEELFKDFFLAPIGKAFIDTVPFAVSRWQQTPLRPATCYPQDGRKEFPTLALRADINAWARSQKG